MNNHQQTATRGVPDAKDSTGLGAWGESAAGWTDEKGAATEVTAAMKLAGADLIITYYAEQLADWMRGRDAAAHA